jgi:hypothetical protein
MKFISFKWTLKHENQLLQNTKQLHNEINYGRQYIPWWFLVHRFMLSYSALIRFTINHTEVYLYVHNRSKLPWVTIFINLFSVCLEWLYPPLIIARLTIGPGCSKWLDFLPPPKGLINTVFYKAFNLKRKSQLFTTATFFGLCIIHILHIGCAKI